MTTPPWSAPVNGMPGDLNATNTAAQLNQFLGSHAFQKVYTGNQIITPDGGDQLTWLPMPNTLDFSQPITMSGTTIGRVQLPLMPVGQGADVLVSLYPDNGSGSPNTSGNPISATMLTGAYLNQVAATAGLDNATGPLQTERDNQYAFTGGTPQSFPWNVAAGSASGAIQGPVICTTSDTVLFLGGSASLSGPVLASCSSATATDGVLGQPIPQPALPQATAFGGATVVNESVVVYCGGSTTSTAAVTNVWAASWTPGTHSMGAWSAQNALPAAVQHTCVTSWNDTVYVIGGGNVSGTVVSSVYLANVTNGQVGAWQTSQPLPIAVADAMAATVAGWLFVFGGDTNIGSTTGLTSVYYAKIKADGSLGLWQAGPSMPHAALVYASGWSSCATESAIFQISTHNASTLAGPGQILTVTEDGPAPFWYANVWNPTFSGDMAFLPVSLGTGQWTLFVPVPEVSEYMLSAIAPMPYVSVPLYASGLTNGATYHVVVQAADSSSASDGVQLGTLDGTALPAVALQSPRHQGSWSHIASGYSVPLTVWDATASADGLARHLWQDPVNGQAQAWATEWYNSLHLTAGVADVTMQPNNPLNSNPTFASGVTPWTATNGTVTQSNAQTHGGFAFSGLLTPAGGNPIAYAASEEFPAQQSGYGSEQWYAVTGWFYTPTTWANFSLSVNWYDSGANYITTSSSAQSLTGATWTQVTNFVQPPATAAFGQIAPTMAGTPGAGNLLYMSDVFLAQTPETVSALTSAATVNYSAGIPFPPVGVTQLN